MNNTEELDNYNKQIDELEGLINRYTEELVRVKQYRSIIRKENVAGKLCRVYNYPGEFGDREVISLINFYDPTTQVFLDTQNIKWNFASPVTLEEVKPYLKVKISPYEHTWINNWANWYVVDIDGNVWEFDLEPALYRDPGKYADTLRWYNVHGRASRITKIDMIGRDWITMKGKR